jgi:hypothetical protein
VSEGRRTRFAITRDDKVLGECLAHAPWDLFMLAVTARWSAHCDRIDMLLGYYGLGRN